MDAIKYSVVIPVYKNAASLPALLNSLEVINTELHGSLEVVFVVDGSPDNSYTILNDAIEGLGFPSQLIAHSRNFGSFPAIRTGLIAARGKYFAVMAADLQEPPSLVVKFFDLLSTDKCDVTVGTRVTRDDPVLSRFTSKVFWRLYKKFIVPEMPEGGVDIFGCNQIFRDELVALDESRSSLIALVFWLGFRRELVPYDRLPRNEGTSGWTLNKKVTYMMDSIFAFTDLPIRLLIRLGMIGLISSFVLGVTTLLARSFGLIDVSGYTTLILVVLFFGALNTFSLGLVGTYAWRGYENTKKRPQAIVAKKIMNARGKGE
jgi:polyisoprenyl-phosphate glycosyltransferase